MRPAPCFCQGPRSRPRQDRPGFAARPPGWPEFAGRPPILQLRITVLQTLLRQGCPSCSYRGCQALPHGRAAGSPARGPSFRQASQPFQACPPSYHWLPNHQGCAPCFCQPCHLPPTRVARQLRRHEWCAGGWLRCRPARPGRPPVLQLRITVLPPPGSSLV